MEISSSTLIPLFRPGSVHIGSASWYDCDRVFPDELRVSSFPDRFPHYAWTAAQSAHSDFLGSKLYARPGVTCYLHFWQNHRGLLRSTAVTWGRNRHRIRVSTQSWLWRRKLSRRSCRDLNSQTFRSRVRRSNQQAIPAPHWMDDSYFALVWSSRLTGCCHTSKNNLPLCLSMSHSK